MPVDLAVAIPAFLDLTVVGLDVPPELGEERFASDLRRSPGLGVNYEGPVLPEKEPAEA